VARETETKVWKDGPYEDEESDTGINVDEREGIITFDLVLNVRSTLFIVGKGTKEV